MTQPILMIFLKHGIQIPNFGCFALFYSSGSNGLVILLHLSSAIGFVTSVVGNHILR